MSTPLHVLFVCTANVCRSPFMELYTRQVLGPDAHLTLGSAGTHGWTDRPMSEEMAAELSRREVDPTGFRSRPLTADLLDHADLVLTAERRHRQFILDDHAGAFRKVLTLGQAVRATGLVEVSAAGGVLGELARHRGTALPDQDVDDPFGRGPVAAAMSARRITDMLDALLPVLAPLATAPGRNPAHD